MDAEIHPSLSSEISVTQPHAAHVPFVNDVVSKWNYLVRSMYPQYMRFLITLGGDHLHKVFAQSD